MIKLRFSLFTRIIIWFFLNLLLLGAILFVFFTYNFRFRPNSEFSGDFGNNIEAVTRQISNEVDDKTREERDMILKNYSERYSGVEFFLFDFKGNQLGGREINLPAEVFREITLPEDFPPPPAPSKTPKTADRRAPPNRPMPPPSIYLRTESPTQYWFGGKTMTFEKSENQMIRTRLVAVSDSFYGYGLFFNPFPWIILVAVIVIVSILFWLPFVRSITKSVGQITKATEQIAEEDFAVRVSEKRTDELGRLSTAINHLAKRLSGFVGGQKRFLGDISHELNSPLARMSVGLSIIEEQANEKSRPYIEDVKEEVEIMAKLVKELLTYSKAGIKGLEIEVEEIELLPLIEEVVMRETVNETAKINVQIDKNTKVLARSDLISRALGNVVRNAIRYAGNAGEIKISTEKFDNDLVEITIADQGAGVPEDSLEKIFDPLYRVESHRSRETGGSGLGLAIVKTCIEACGGKVHAKNLVPKGFAVIILLKIEFARKNQ